MKNLFKKLFKKHNKPIQEITKQNVKLSDPIKENDHVARLLKFKEKRALKTANKYPHISDPTYNRKYDRYQTIKSQHEYKHQLALKGKRLTEDGIITVQQPYPQYPNQSLKEYNQYVRGFNYKNR